MKMGAGLRRLIGIACNLVLSKRQERGVDDHNTMAFLAHIVPYLTVRDLIQSKLKGEL